MLSDEELEKIMALYSHSGLQKLSTNNNPFIEFGVQANLLWSLLIQAKAANMLAKTLQFYADEKNNEIEGAVFADGGEKARQTLRECGIEPGTRDDE